MAAIVVMLMEACWFGSTGVAMTADQKALQMRVLAAQIGVDLDELALPIQGFEVVSTAIRLASGGSR